MPIPSAAAAWATRAMPGFPGMGLGNFVRVRLRATAATLRAHPLARHPGAFEHETLCYVPAVWAGDRVDRHENNSHGKLAGIIRQARRLYCYAATPLRNRSRTSFVPSTKA
jgi:hypothetical protein